MPLCRQPDLKQLATVDSVESSWCWRRSVSVRIDPPGGLPPSPQLHVTPSPLKLDWKAGPKRPETGVTAGVREGEWEGELDEKKTMEERRRESGEIGEKR
ncbi:hypothetical protein NQZ68_026771 [Dissostichus eleginoides]|nr:hypothetical protein NQZ68_026771 [Dissostichus eleginoides]